MFKNNQFNQLIINKLDFIEWKKESPKILKNNEATTVWKIKIAPFIPQIDVLKVLLEPAELDKAMRYQQENDQNQRIIGKAVLRILLSKYTCTEPKLIVFSADENKKPVVGNFLGQQIHFNVSHSGGYVLIAISTNPTGIDIEQLNTAFTYQNLLEYAFSESERLLIDNSAHPHHTFFELWTRKEALLKATGKGLDDDLAKIPCLNGIHQIQKEVIRSNENWQISSFQIDENHVGSIAFMPVKTVLQFVNFQL